MNRGKKHETAFEERLLLIQGAMSSCYVIASPNLQIVSVYIGHRILSQKSLLYRRTAVYSEMPKLHSNDSWTIFSREI